MARRRSLRPPRPFDRRGSRPHLSGCARLSPGSEISSPLSPPPGPHLVGFTGVSGEPVPHRGSERRSHSPGRRRLLSLPHESAQSLRRSGPGGHRTDLDLRPPMEGGVDPPLGTPLPPDPLPGALGGEQNGIGRRCPSGPPLSPGGRFGSLFPDPGHRPTGSRCPDPPSLRERPGRDLDRRRSGGVAERRRAFRIL
jgi:hypothetical protein